MLNLKDKIYSFVWALMGGFIAFYITAKFIPVTADSTVKEIVLAGFIIGFGAGSPTLYSIYQEISLRKNLKILIYEDDNKQRQQLVNNLRNASYQVVDFGAGDFTKACDTVRNDKNVKVAIVDQIILNEQGKELNGQQGFELVQAFSNIYRSDIKCIMLTGELLEKASSFCGNKQLAENIDRYLRADNVVDVIHKQLYQDGDQFTQALYTRILKQIELLLKAGYLK